MAKVFNMHAAIFIRPIEKKDNMAVSKLIRTVMTEFGAVGEGYSIMDAELDDMYSAYAKSEAAFYVIEKDGNVMGCGGIAPLAGAESDVCELRKMYFQKEVRGLGLGKQLMEECLAKAKKLGYKTCYLETISSMKRAGHLYKKYGFEALDAPMGHTGHTSCQLYYAKKL